MRQATENILLNHSNYTPEGIDTNFIAINKKISKDINSKLLMFRNNYWIGVDNSKVLKDLTTLVVNESFINSIDLFTDITCIIKKSKLKSTELVTTQTVAISSGSEETIGGGIGGGGIGIGGIENDSINLEDLVGLVENGYLYGSNVSILFGNNNFIEIP